MKSFKMNPNTILVATDVASRGLDVKNIILVINFDFPQTIEDYIHRIGRTRRHGNKGTAISFFTSENFRLKNELINFLEICGQKVNPDLMI